MSLGKYLTNFAVISSLIGAFSTLKQTQQMPKDWRRALVWGTWAIGFALAILGVIKREEDAEFAAEQQREAEALKQLTKSQRKSKR